MAMTATTIASLTLTECIAQLRVAITNALEIQSSRTREDVRHHASIAVVHVGKVHALVGTLRMMGVRGGLPRSFIASVDRAADSLLVNALSLDTCRTLRDTRAIAHLLEQRALRMLDLCTERDAYMTPTC